MISLTSEILLSIFSWRPLVFCGKYMYLKQKVSKLCHHFTYTCLIPRELAQSSLGIEIMFRSFFFFSCLRILCTPWILSISCLMMIDKNKFDCSALPLWKMLACTRFLHPLTIPSLVWIVLKLKSKQLSIFQLLDIFDFWKM